jgi:hypothetical protein
VTDLYNSLVGFQIPANYGRNFGRLNQEVGTENRRFPIAIVSSNVSLTVVCGEKQMKRRPGNYDDSIYGNGIAALDYGLQAALFRVPVL